MMHKQHGFTIIELMIATTVFSIIMLVAAAGVLKFTHAYFKGVTASDTQTVARTIMADIVQNIQFGQNISVANTPTSGSEAFCIDNTLYSYLPNAEVTSGTADGTRHLYNHGLVKQIYTACSGSPALDLKTITTLRPPAVLGDAREMLSEHMRIAKLQITSSGDNLYTVNLKIIYGDDDLLTNGGDSTTIADAGCTSQAGSQYCAVSELTTTVQQRQ
jgi:prepilin-type N-terminal cleavage/methylation domain-containing protein